ncbi:3D domain-containing protein [Brassicibacter mesophilus]|uniref:3D domain-containing protein n=1 Tax=Brassicibacter mesophilus TaxID=745119 RepID=UPI003D250099
MVELIKNNKHLFVSIVILIGIVAASFVAYDLVFHDVAISVDGDEIMLKTSKATVSELLGEKKINLDKEDYINVSLDRQLEDGLKIDIKKAVPITVTLGNKKLEVKTAKDTVKEALDSLEIAYDENDKIEPSLNEKVTSKLEINVTRVDEKIEVKSEEIPYKTITKNNKDLEKGKNVKVQNGERGLKEVKIKEIYENGELISSEIMEESVAKEPVNEIIEKGTKDFEIASRGSFAGKRSAVMVATAYDLTYESTGKRPGDKYYGMTASGTRARPGVVAVDPKVIPLGTKLYIESLDGSKDYGYAVAEDTGGAIKGNRIDLFFESPKDVKAFGLRKVRVYIISGK